MYKVFVGNLNFRTSEEQIRELFQSHLPVEDVAVARDPKTAKSLGYAFVMTRDEQQGKKIVRTMPKMHLDGRLIYLKEATGKRKKKKHAPQTQSSAFSGGGQGGFPRRPRPTRVHSIRRSMPTSNAPSSPPPRAAVPNTAPQPRPQFPRGYTGLDDAQP